jgi:SCY1-like protein 2
MKEFVNPTMVPFVLPNVLLVAEDCSRDEYAQHILSHLKPVMKMQDPIQVINVFFSSLPF